MLFCCCYVVIVLCRSKLPTKITKAAVAASSSLPQGAKSLLPLPATKVSLEKDRKKKNLVVKSTLSNVNPPQQFCDSRLAKPASFLPLGSTHLSKPVGPGQTKKSVDKLKRINAVGLGSVNPPSCANQPKRSASGEGEGTGEVELELVLKPEIVDMDEFQILPGPPTKAVSGVRSQGASKRNGIVPPATTVKNQVSKSFVYKK